MNLFRPSRADRARALHPSAGASAVGAVEAIGIASEVEAPLTMTANESETCSAIAALQETEAGGIVSMTEDEQQDLRQIDLIVLNGENGAESVVTMTSGREMRHLHV